METYDPVRHIHVLWKEQDTHRCLCGGGGDVILVEAVKGGGG